MMDNDRHPNGSTSTDFAKVAIISELIKKASGKLGRTGLMKCLFFLKTLRNVPLPYNFRLYTYGPFDANVLEDLQYAETLGAVRSVVVDYPGGYGYQLDAGTEVDKLGARALEFLAQHKDSIDWVINEFGNRTASDLEMSSTLIYIDRALASRNSKVSIIDLAKKVHDVKPHITTDAIVREAQRLNDKGFLKAIA